MTEDWTEEIVLESSNIYAVRYHLSEGYLDVTFRNGGHYRYRSVPPHIFELLTSAPSPGSFLSRRIKNVFPVDKIA